MSRQTRVAKYSGAPRGAQGPLPTGLVAGWRAGALLVVWTACGQGPADPGQRHGRNPNSAAAQTTPTDATPPGQASGQPGARDAGRIEVESSSPPPETDHAPAEQAKVEPSKPAAQEPNSPRESTVADSGIRSEPDIEPTVRNCNAIKDQAVVNVEPGESLQRVLDALGPDNSTPTIVQIPPGVYEEKLVIDTPQVTLCGQVGQARNTRLTFRDGNDTAGGTTASAAIRINADDVSGENLTLENSRGPGTQAVALLIHGDRVQFLNSRFLGFQDTLYVRGARNYFRDCYVEGTVDFVFGDATAVFENCTLHSVDQGTAVTAPSTPEEQPAGLVFVGGRWTAEPQLRDGSVHLGRNWRPFGSTVLLGTELGAHIAPSGWIAMGDNELSTSRFAEYSSTGPGAAPSARVTSSRQLSDIEVEQYSLASLFGSWTPSYSR